MNNRERFCGGTEKFNSPEARGWQEWINSGYSERVKRIKEREIVPGKIVSGAEPLFAAEATFFYRIEDISEEGLRRGSSSLQEMISKATERLRNRE